MTRLRDSFLFAKGICFEKNENVVKSKSDRVINGGTLTIIYFLVIIFIKSGHKSIMNLKCYLIENCKLQLSGILIRKKCF